MKKVLFASTALVAAAFAAPNFASAQSVSAGNADIDFGGYARWGVGYVEDRAEEAIIISRFRLNINASVETDSGLRFAATVRGQSDENSDGTAGSFTFGGARYQVSTGGLRVRFGNISGVFDDSGTIRPFSDIGLEGTIGMVSSFGFPGAAFGNGQGDNGVLVNYAFGDLRVAASYVDDSGSLDGEDEYQVGLGYTFGDYNFGAVYGEDQDEEFYLVSVDGSIGVFGFAAVIGQNNSAIKDNLAYGLSLDYDLGAATNVKFVYSGGGDTASDAYGLGFSHELGAGSRLQGFVGQTNGDVIAADLGVRFDF